MCTSLGSRTAILFQLCLHKSRQWRWSWKETVVWLHETRCVQECGVAVQTFVSVSSSVHCSLHVLTTLSIQTSVLVSMEETAQVMSPSPASFSVSARMVSLVLSVNRLSVSATHQCLQFMHTLC